MPDFIHIHPNDNVAVALHPITAGTEFRGITAKADIPQGHKMALKALAEKATIQQTQGELSEDALDQVAGGFVSSHTAVVGFVARHIGYISKWLRR